MASTTPPPLLSPRSCCPSPPKDPSSGPLFYASATTSSFHAALLLVRGPPRRLRLAPQKVASSRARASRVFAMAANVESYKEVLPEILTSASDPPALFDGTTRLYISYVCPYAQRAWIARNYKGLQEKVKLVPIDLGNRPAWYKEKVYPPNKVPSLEHNNEVKGESLDLVRYIDSQFEGPALIPDDPEKRHLGEELISYSDSFNSVNFKAFTSQEDPENEIGAAYNKLEEALSKFDDGPFFLGQFSYVDVAYAPFIERFQPFFADVKNYDITKRRPRLAQWIAELNKLGSYTQTKRDPQELLGAIKQKFGLK